VPLLPDPNTVGRTFRPLSRRFRRQTPGRHFWGSSPYAKDTPCLEDWAAFLKSIGAKFVLLQYGNIAGEVAKIKANARKPVIHDATVDQLKDMDRFAAQIASLDAVVTISNTGAHLAGALGVPAIIIIDDNFRRTWSIGTERTPYYPAVTLVAKNGRTWAAVMTEATKKLDEILANCCR
jgi:ADP-heptose:LPS heptosyltransferase